MKLLGGEKLCAFVAAGTFRPPRSVTVSTALSNNEVLLRFRAWQHLAPSTYFPTSILPKFKYGTVHSLKESPHIMNLIRRESPTIHLIWFTIFYFNTFKTFSNAGKKTGLVIFLPLEEALNFRSIMFKLNLNNKSRKLISNFKDLYYRTDPTQ